MKVEVRLKPLGKYFFGSEKGFNNSGLRITEKNKSYYIKSENIPQQTSILGMLRFEILKQYELLNPGGEFKVKKYDLYDEKEHKLMKKIIGPKSFDIEESNQSFGYINSISSVQLFHYKIGKMIKMPFDHQIYYKSNNEKRKNRNYKPYKLKKLDGVSNHGELFILKDYNAKDGLFNEFWISNDLNIHENIFITSTEVGIKIIPNFKKNKKDENEGFFKQDFKILEKGYEFVFQIDLDDSIQLKDSVVELGKERSSFKMTVEKNLKNQEIAIENDGKIIFLSDTYLTKKQLDEIDEKLKFSLIKEKEFRNLDRKIIGGYKFIAAKHYFIERGSVYYLKEKQQKQNILDSIRANKDLVNIGYNDVV